MPGFIAFIIFRKIAVYRKSSKKQFGFSEVFVVVICSLLICFIYDFFIFLINKLFKTGYTSTISKLFNVEIYNTTELLFLCIISIILGFLLSGLESKKLINKVAVKLKITQYYGEEDIWTTFCSNNDINWVYVRDHKYNLIYYGAIKSYSDPEEDRELILTDVQVFSSDGELCYNSPVLYICRHHHDITIEKPLIVEGEKDAKIDDKIL
jgi:hypothetical protein